MLSRYALLLCSALVAAAPAYRGNAQTPAAIGLQNDVIFTEYSPLSSGAERVRRLFSPLRALRLNQETQRLGRTLNGQSIELANERFSIYVPPHSPPQGYSLLVFVPPWSRAEVPPHWIAALDRHDMILVTAANSGNDANVLDRREPLALLAVHNVLARYRVDPLRVYISGFSGGSRVALRLALGYPDVFHGALLNAGSDPVGNADVPLPPAELFHQFQESTRLVYVTGERDEAHLIDDTYSRQSLEKWCVFDVITETEARMGHELANAASFSRSLDDLVSHTRTSAPRLADCRARIERELTTQLQQVRDALAHGDHAAARRLVESIDARYGGLAAPRSLELAAQ